MLTEWALTLQVKLATMNALERIIDDYISDHQCNAEREQRWFAIQRSLRAAVEVAALAKSPKGKRLSHQCRIPGRVLEKSRECLLKCLSTIRQARSFEELHELVALAIRRIRGIGELTVYDTALRIGAFRHLEPNKVFLHAGTRAGARRLGLDVSKGVLKVSELPAELRVLKPREIEDVLCISTVSLCGST
jgi:hypothetical protein